MKRLIGFLFVLTLAVSAFGIKIGEYTLSFDDTSNNFYRNRIGYKLRLDSIRIHGELNQMNLNALRYFALWGDVKGIDLSDCVIKATVCQTTPLCRGMQMELSPGESLRP